MTAGASGGLVVVGASLAGLRAVESARRSGYDGGITLIGSESHLPYDRPPLSKTFVTSGAEPKFFCDEAYLREELRVRCALGVTATGLDPDRSVLRTSAGEVAFDRLIVATGSAARALPVGVGMAGVLTLRTLDDALAIRAAVRASARVVVVGGGFIGSEIASSVGALGGRVTLVEASSLPLQRATGSLVGHALVRLHERNGTTVKLGVAVRRLLGSERVTGVELSDGEVVKADLVVVGIGSAPATDWLANSGVRRSDADGGVLCDEFLASSRPDVYAAGDVVHWPNEVMDSSSMRLENWTSAAEQGAAAARNALFPDQAAPYSTVPYVWSDWYSNRLQFVGHPATDEVRVVSGSLEGPKFVALYRGGDRLMGAVTLNEPGKVMKYRRLVQARGTWAEALALYPQQTHAENAVTGQRASA